MIGELQRRNFAESTIRSYVHGVEHFSQYFHRRPDRLGPQHIRDYQAMLFSKLKYSPNTVIQQLGALRFFYIKVLKKNWSIAETPPQVNCPEQLSRKYLPSRQITLIPISFSQPKSPATGLLGKRMAILGFPNSFLPT
jgi:site-specific recombinase XerD